MRDLVNFLTASVWLGGAIYMVFLVTTWLIRHVRLEYVP
jgi:hypothetical protein